MITSVCERLQAFTSVCERLRARQVAFGRVWSRLVAFSRANFFFGSGHVWACSVISCRHFSSFFVPKCFFRVWRATGGCGSGWAGRAAVCCAWFPRRGQDVHHVMIIVSNWFATAAGPRLRWFVLRTIVLQNRGVCGSLYSQGCIPDSCASGKAKRLKQLRPGLTERSRAECRHRQGIPFGLLNPFSSSTPFHINEKLGCTHAREARVGAEQLGCVLSVRAPRFTALQSL